MPSSRSHPKERRWSRPLTIGVVSLLAFETLTGLAIWLLPFSVSAQMTVLLHTVGGVVLLGPYLVYQVRHWRVHFANRPLDYLKLTGYFSLVATAVALVSGFVLTAQALFGRAIGQTWSRVHLLSTFALLGALLIHLLGPVVRGWNVGSSAMKAIRRAQGWFGWNVAFHTGVGLALVGLFAYAYSPVSLYRERPASYSLPYGSDSLFAPSLAETASGRLLNPKALGGSKGCGAAGCHKQIYKEWAPSAHRYSAMDPAFRVIQKRMAKRKGPYSTRYCGGCHDPISLLSGSKSMLREDMSTQTGYHEGTSCLSCHAVQKVDVRGNADYVIDPPKRYLGALRYKKESLAWEVTEFLIRAFPEYHRESLSRPLYKTPAFCGSCHKQFIPKEINDFGRVELQNQYDNWRKSRWHHPKTPSKTIRCQECHMPLKESFDPARGEAADYTRTAHDGKHRSHRFQAANQVMPTLLGLPGAKKQVAAVEKWLKGNYEIPEISHKWTEGPVVPLEILAPDTVRAGQSVDVQVRLTNNKAGHNFPTGPLDVIQSWVRIAAITPAGDTLFSSGELTKRHFIEPGSFVFKAEPVDASGNLIDFHNLWEMVGSTFSRSLYPGFSDRADYRFRVPSVVAGDAGDSTSTAPPRPTAAVSSGDETVRQATYQFEASSDASGSEATRIRIRAALDYRKFNQPIFNELLRDSLAVETVPVTTLSTDADTLIVLP